LKKKVIIAVKSFLSLSFFDRGIFSNYFRFDGFSRILILLVCISVNELVILNHSSGGFVVQELIIPDGITNSLGGFLVQKLAIPGGITTPLVDSSSRSWRFPEEKTIPLVDSSSRSWPFPVE
jgi:hypothetical protein